MCSVGLKTRESKENAPTQSERCRSMKGWVEPSHVALDAKITVLWGKVVLQGAAVFPHPPGIF